MYTKVGVKIYIFKTKYMANMLSSENIIMNDNTVANKFIYFKREIRISIDNLKCE